MTARRALRRATAACAAVALAVVGLVVGPMRTASGTATDVPGQFIAKLYTEALGRVPTGAEWNEAVSTFSDGGCTPQTLADVGQQVYTSADFARLGYDNSARLLSLFRGVWNTEPDTTELSQWESALDHGDSWSTVVARFFVADRFTDLVPRICAGGSDSSSTSYAVAGQPPTPLPTQTAGFSGDEDELQQILDDTPRGGTVQLAGRSLITLTRPLKVPSGVTLTTSGEPDPAHYAEMGRLVRGGDFDEPLIELTSGARLTGVWVDGGRNSPGNSAPNRVNVRVLGGTGTAVTGNKLSNTAGSSSVQVLGRAGGYACSRVTVSDNVITAYSNDHYLTRQLPGGANVGTWSDGIASGCADTTITGNQIVDTGGNGISLFRGDNHQGSSVHQHSTVRDNTIVSAGVPMYAGIVADPLYYVPGKGSARSYDFTRTTISHNTLWSAPNTHFVIGISAGSRPWYAGTAMVGPNSGRGLAITDNGTGGVAARVRTGIAISGMSGVRLGSDPAIWLHDDVPGKPGNACPAADVAASRAAGTADALQTDVAVADLTFDGCMGEP